jgi:hypothetical protein
MSALMAIIVGVIVAAIAREAKAWLPYLSQRLLRRTLASFPLELPEDVRLRWVEEIEGDFSCLRDRPMGAFAFAINVWRKGARHLAEELSFQEKLATSGSPRRGADPLSADSWQALVALMDAYAKHEPEWASKMLSEYPDLSRDSTFLGLVDEIRADRPDDDG